MDVEYACVEEGGGGAVCCTATEIGSFTELCNVLCSEYKSCTSFQLRGVWTFSFFIAFFLLLGVKHQITYSSFFYFSLFFSVVFLLSLVLFSVFLSAVVCNS